MEGTLGIENLKLAIAFGSNLGESLDKKLDDGKIGIFEGINLIKNLKDIPKIIRNGKKIQDEFADLDQM